MGLLTMIISIYLNENLKFILRIYLAKSRK